METRKEVTDKQKIAHEPPPTKRNLVSLLLRVLVPIVSIVFFSGPLAEILLIVSGHPNAPAAIDMARDPEFSLEPLATYTLLPTYTDLPTLTPEPTYTPLATYTDLPTLTPEPTYTPLATYTPYPTYTPLPTNTPTPTSTSTPTPTPIPPGAVLAHIQAEEKALLVVADLHLTEAEFHVGVDHGGLRSFGGDFTAYGTIGAGLDLTELDGDNILYDAATQTYTLILHSPQLTSCDVKYIRLVRGCFNLLNPDCDQLRLLGEVQVMDIFIDRALESGIIDDAKKQSALILEDLVRAFTGERVVTRYDSESGKVKKDKSCEPGLSDSWRFDGKVWHKRES